ncbi:MAG: cupin [Rhodospirillaceae bacterium]|nr:MAG: cupin [Rhodospirillaceae bacterium]
MVRRVVTAVEAGKSIFRSDGSVPTEHVYKALPGFMTSICWSTSAQPSNTSVIEAAPLGTRAIPGPGETRLMIVRFPPDSVMVGPGFDPKAAGAEQTIHMPGLAELFEIDNPGMHRTNSIDYDIVLSGEIWLELDNGAEKHLRAGDIVIQQATRHAWRNRGQTDANMAFILIGTATTS